MKPTRIDAKFAELKERGEKGFIAYITAGDPDLAATEDAGRREGNDAADQHHHQDDFDQREAGL